MKSLSLVTALLVVAGALVATPATAEAKSQKTEAPLVRPPGAPDANAKGRVRVEHDNGDNRDKMNVEAEYIDTSLTFEVFVETGVGSGNLSSAGTMHYNAPGEVEIEYDTDEGPPLPLGANNVAALAGRRVEVRSGGQVYLEGIIPAIGGSTGGGGGGDDSSGSGGSGGDWQKLKSFLMRPVAPPDGNATGYVEIRKRPADNREKFKVEAEHLGSGLTLFVFVETGAGTGVLQSVGVLPPDGDPGEYELELDTGDGQALPFGVSGVDALAGRRVEVRDGSDTVYLFGSVPSFGGQQPQVASTKILAPSANATVKMKIKPKAAFESFDLKVKKALKNSSLTVHVFDTQASQFVEVALIQTNGGGKARYRVKTKSGKPLPLGVATVKDLGGRTIEVRDLQGTVLLAGTLPQF